MKRSIGFISSGILKAVIFVAACEYISILLLGKPDVLFKSAFSSLDFSLLLSTIVTINGVFLALFFSAFTTSAGPLLLKASEDLQNIMLNDRQFKHNINTLVMTTVIGLLYLALDATSYLISPIGPTILTLLAIYVIFRFLLLGDQAFSFIQPEHACIEIITQAHRCIISAKAGNLGWNHTSFQNHYQKQAEKSFKAMRNLIHFGRTAIILSEEQYVVFIKYIIGLLNYYIVDKKRIPTDSRWFWSKMRFQKWLLASSSELGVRLRTGTTLTPQPEKDYHRFEEECLNLIFDIISNLVEKEKNESATQCINMLSTTMHLLARECDTATTRLVMNRVVSLCEHHFEVVKAKPQLEASIESLGLIDCASKLAIDLEVAFSNYFESHSKTVIYRILNSIKWHNVINVYSLDLPSQMIPFIEYIHKQYITELHIEGSAVTPQWYLNQIVCSRYLSDITNMYRYIESLNNSFYKHFFDYAFDSKLYSFAADITERWIEYAHKLKRCCAVTKAHVQELSDFKRNSTAIWVDFDFEKEGNLAKDNYGNAVDKMVDLLQHLAISPDKTLPDYFGHGLILGLEALFDSGRENNTERFSSLFSSIFIAALQEYDHLRLSLTDYIDEQNLIWSFEVIEDLLTISGFAFLFTELHGNDLFWSRCRATWDRYFNSKDKTISASIALMFIHVIKYRDSLFMLMPRASHRQEWLFSWEQLLRDMTLIETRDFFNHGRTANSVTHPSRIINYYISNSLATASFTRDLFCAAYLCDINKDGITVSRNIQRIYNFIYDERLGDSVRE